MRSRALELAAGVLCTGVLAGLVGSEFTAWNLGFDKNIIGEYSASVSGLFPFWSIFLWCVRIDNPVVVQGFFVTMAVWGGMLSGWMFGMVWLTDEVKDRLERKCRFYHERGD